MVFPGRFSTGCKRCRQRKLKCDEARPSCRRCYIYGKPCPGYTDQFQFRFENAGPKQENSSSSSLPSPTSQRSEHSPVPSRTKPAKANTKNIIVPIHHTPPLSITAHPEVSYDQYSLSYFVQRFVTPDEHDNFPGFLSFLPSLYNHNANGGLLELATLSVAQMAAYNQFGGDKFRLQSYQNYGRALRTLRQTIETEEDIKDDRVLAAVLLLCMFKDVGEQGWGDPNEHASGLYYILERRGFEQLFTSVGFELFITALLKLQVHSFLHQDDRYGDPGGIVSWLSPFDPMMRAMSLMTKVLSLRHDLGKCTADPEISEELGHDDSAVNNNEGTRDASTLEACFNTLAEFDTWDIEAESYWRNTFEGRSVPAATGKFSTSGTAYDTRTACTIILVRSARLIMLLSILEYRDATQKVRGKGNDAAWGDCVPVLEENIRLVIDDMLWCVPFAMGDFNPNKNPVMLHDGAAALTIIQPLRLITYCVYASPEQNAKAQGILSRMNAGIGIRSAISWEEQAILEQRDPTPRRLNRIVTGRASSASPVLQSVYPT
ncbi:hypothetical protein GGR57DRAFT_227669 [Xylariaceae sp. FL1272]|nr:hypothetical protein GGR57DRAFT_227669 [Xylariaceae sp. FL1272]